MAGGTGKALPLPVQMRRKLQGDVSTDWLSRSIFKVPNHLRQISEHAYEPQVISIGPYHHGKGQLKKMEEYKMFYLKMLLWRRRESSPGRYVAALKDMEEKAREFYSEPLDHIGGENFVEMMLLDGCFIIELIRKSAMKEHRDQNDHLLTHFILRRAMLDLLLVENQIPFFILSELFDMTVMPNDEAKDFVYMAIEFFSKIVPGSLRRPENQDIKHLLGLLHDSSQAPSPDCPEVRISCLPEKVKRSLCPEVMLKAMAIPCLSSSPSKSAEEDEKSESAKEDEECESAEEDEESESAENSKMPMEEMAAPLVCFSSPESSEEVKFPRSDSDNLLFGAAPSITFLPPKAMTIPSSSLSKSSEEIVSTAAPSVGVSASNSLKGVKSLPSDSSHPRYLKEMDAPAAEPSISFSPPKSSEEVRCPLPKAMWPTPLPYLQPKPQLDSMSASEPNRKEWRFIRSATELNEAGINFKKIEGRLFDIKFQKGKMLIPTLSVNDDTESILRNLVAYEQCFKGASSKCFTDYITFMDCLINTGKDVELLCLRGVIDN